MALSPVWQQTRHSTISGSHHHHYHLVARSKIIAVSTVHRQEVRSVARRNAEWSPRLSGLRSLLIVRSQDWRGRPLGQRQSTGRRSVDAHSAREWSSEAAARAIWPNSLRRRCCISEETGVGRFVSLWPYRYVGNVCRLILSGSRINFNLIRLIICSNIRRRLIIWHTLKVLNSNPGSTRNTSV